MVEVKKLRELFVNGNISDIKQFITNNNLEIRNGKIFSKNISEIKKQVEYYDGLQHAKKLLLNATYGTLLQPSSRFFDKRVGQSVTLTGRGIVRHQSAFINECFTGEYNYLGKCIHYGDTDSIFSDGIIDTTEGKMTIEQLYHLSNEFINSTGKEYGMNKNIQVKTYDPEIGKDYFANIDFVYRHQVSKERWEIEDFNGNKIEVTNDHSIMIERNGIMIECKPGDIKETDLLISVIDTRRFDANDSMVEKVKIKSIKKLSNFDNEYVYDIGIHSPEKKHNWFFANNILVHNSTQFSAWPVMKDMVDEGQVEWNRDIAVQLYLKIGEQVNDSYAEYMTKSYNCPDRYANLIKSSCESVGYRGLYITKKRYAILNYFKDGKFYEDDHLKLKAMGLDLRRSDTPEVCQKFLSEILMDLLQGKTVDDLTAKINIFKDKFKALPLHEQGTPKRVNKLTFYADQIAQGKGNRVPGHVRAAINWNSLRKMNNDNVHTRIVDGQKCVVCPLKENQLNMTSVAYPTDESHLPDWFTKLPFDNDAMIAAVVDKKLENLLGKLPIWKAIEEGTRKINTFFDFFE